MTAGIVIVAALAGLLFAALYFWCLGTVTEIPGATTDPVGDLVIAWWLTLAWLDHWTTEAIR